MYWSLYRDHQGLLLSESFVFFLMNILRNDIEIGKCWGFCRGGCMLQYVCNLLLESSE